MKILIITTIFLTNILFANYAYNGENSGKIDMHGGKKDALLKDKKGFSNSNLNSLGNIGINKPSAPKTPNTLIVEPIKEPQTPTTK